ncbi:MAG: chromosomal replication initiator protein DnaA [Clostridia bacterium]|nr:chromosomal replication initiator protein DnaA [Clostridia bacterium]
MAQDYIKEIHEFWEIVKNSFRDTLPETAINLWFGEVEILSYQDDVITMGIASEMKFRIIQDKYLEQIEKSFTALFGFDVKVNLTYTGSAVRAQTLEPEKKPSAQKEANAQRISSYDFEYTFDNFIVGSTNTFAHAACVSVSNNLADRYNPLFIYGNSGLGKTHLLYATINQIKKNNPNIKIIYTKGEDFINQMVSCLANHTMEEFRDKYRKCDVLLIDDIQFIAGKVAMQEEFFHTFNALYEDKKQIILTSDRPPRDIKTLEDRLKTRFEWGLIADIEPPDLELRIAIIKKKAEQVNITIPNDVLNFLAENLRSNIRQIEGAIKKLGALTFLSGKSINMELAQECLSELLGGAEPLNVTVDKIFGAVYNKYGISKEQMISPKRNREIAAARNVCIYLIRDITEMSYPAISKIFNRDHSTVITSYNNMVSRYQLDAAFTMEMDELKKEINGIS